MNAMPRPAGLIDRLPPVRGRLAAQAPLSRLTWFGVGGPAEVLFTPADADDLQTFLAARPAGLPVTVIGVGSNLLVRDGGVPGVVIRLGAGFAGIQCDGARVTAGAAARDVAVAKEAAEAGIGGLEFLSGIPGTIGGALRMNAGAYGGEMKDVTVAVRAIDGTGQWRHLTPQDLGFAYRRSSVPEDWIFVEATLEGRPDQADVIAGRLAAIRKTRDDSQPVRSRTGGSTFANPPDAKAWQLIDQAGCRGLRRGGAQVSEKHCNFLINTGGATAADLEDLGEEVRRRVMDQTGIDLHWEIRRIGVRNREEQI
ncbi:MAG TPA: UDP-N-acetylmuramate dehydrogenase [Rhodospirillaceae bacterium]|nr:UDP-N-acetylmuramate dehydrogenase [Rhodospirillaceae bacterium]